MIRKMINEPVSIINLELNPLKKSVTIEYGNLNSLFIVIFSNTKLISMLFAFLCNYVNGKIFLLEIGKVMFDDDFKITFKKVYKGF